MKNISISATVVAIQGQRTLLMGDSSERPERSRHCEQSCGVGARQVPKAQRKRTVANRVRFVERNFPVHRLLMQRMKTLL